MTKPIHIFVTRGQQHLKLEFDTPTTTGLAIKLKAGSTALDGLYHRVHGQVEEILDDQVVELKDGDQFSIVLNGRVS